MSIPSIEILLNKLDPYCGIIGIDEQLSVFEGSDGSITKASICVPDWAFDEESIKEWETTRLTPEEMRLLADEMILRWTKYKAAIGGNDKTTESSEYMLGDLVEFTVGGFGIITEIETSLNDVSYATKPANGFPDHTTTKRAWHNSSDFKRLVGPSPLRGK